MDKDAVTYELGFTIPYLPKMANQQLRGHWRTAYGHAKKVKRSVWRACWPFKPDKPLTRAILTLTRHSSVEPDFDGLSSGFKHVIDGLVECGIIENDKMSCIGQPIYRWEKGKKGKGFIHVHVKGER